MNIFVNDIFEKELYDNVIVKTYPNLGDEHKKILHNYLVKIIDWIAIKFNFDLGKRNIYEHQFRQNDYKDSVGLLFMMLPYINDDDGEKKKRVNDLNDLYVKKVDGFDINEVSPTYEYTNVEYGRCKRVGSRAVEVVFSIEHLRDNFELLKITVKTIANKLYVNWIDVKPFEMDNYEMSGLFRVTSEYVRNGMIERNDYGGIEVGEMYNVLTNYLYTDILSIKWLLYDMVKEGGTIYKLPVMLDKMMDLSECLKFVEWKMISDEGKKKFEDGWTKLIKMFKDGDVHGSDVFKNIENVNVVVVSIISYGRNYIKNAIGDKNKRMVEAIDKINEIDEENDIRGGYVERVRKFLTKYNVNPEIIYGYLSKSLFKLSKTAYAPYYLEYVDGNYKLVDGNESYIWGGNVVTVKCIYNYAKALCHYDFGGKYELYPLQWKSLSRLDRADIERRLLSNGIGWFNISNVLRRRGDRVSSGQVYNIIKNRLVHIIFQVLSNLGLLSVFIPDGMLSDYTNLPSETDARKVEILKRVKNNKYDDKYGKSIYFLDCIPYKAHVIKEKPDKYNIVKSEPYLDGLGAWITFHAMNWISQINTFHHYLNNRVIYVTGGTGVGKSTQFPKLLLYALKMCDYKNDAMIACTAPRINALTSNATQISKEMGIPISENGSKTNNFNVQYKYKDGSHEKTQSGLVLKILTDGILDVQLSNQLLKQDNDIGKNIYDIVIIDEAHEHNTNMDLILTKMRYATYFNNDIKLVIISATMDDDEPIYRRYYRMINDNRMFPLSKDIVDKYDRINVDRRMHISPPGQVTQYTITEKYGPYEFASKSNVAEDVVMKILKDGGTGDILLFQPGIKEISKSVQYINMKSSGNVIAIPYYSEMDKEAKAILEEIHKWKNNLPFSKEKLKTEPSQLIKEIGISDRYDRVVIVSTEIAEASITIQDLRYVVDTGIQKINEFDETSRAETLKKAPISESSRIQRKGRLGRVAPGDAYFTYEKGERAHIKRPYKIAVSYIGDNVFGMLCDKYHEDKPLFRRDNDPNIEGFEWKNDMNDIIKKQYFVGGEFYNYFGNKDHYDYGNDRVEDLGEYYSDGYSLKTLMDEKGVFYIIHPDELCLKRNILGVIVGCDKDRCNDKCNNYKDNKFKSNKIEVLMKMMKENLFLVGDVNKGVYKTELGKKVIPLKQHSSLFNKTNIMLSYLYSIKYGCSENMLKYLVGANMGLTLSDLALKGRFNDLVLLYGDKDGDYDGVVKIFDFILIWFGRVYKTLGLDNMDNSDKKNIWDKIKNDIVIVRKSEYYAELVKMCIVKGLNVEKVVNLWGRYESIRIGLSDVKVVEKLGEIKNLVPLVMKDYKRYGEKDIIKFCLVQGNPNNLLKKITLSDKDQYFVNLLNPSIYNVHKLGKVFGGKNVYNTFMKDGYVGDIIVYLNERPDIETDEEAVTFIMGLDYKYIPKLVPLSIMERKKEFSLDYYKKHMEKYVASLITNNNTLKYNIVNNYVNVVKDIDYKLFNNFDKSYVENVVEVAGGDDEVKRAIMRMKMIGGGAIDGIVRYDLNKSGNYSFARDMMRLRS